MRQKGVVGWNKRDEVGFDSGKLFVVRQFSGVV
jgi:hypothetical protein